jgi:hypothetical protein
MSAASGPIKSFECGSELLKRQFLFDPGYRNLNHGERIMPSFTSINAFASRNHKRFRPQIHSHPLRTNLQRTISMWPSDANQLHS